MARTFKDRRDYEDKANQRRTSQHMSKVLRFSMGRYVRANARHDVEASSRWFTAADRASRIVGTLPSPLTDLD